jgi:alpha-galactosidase
MASHAEVKYVADWAERVFAGRPTTTEQSPGLLSETEVPFSFRYGGQPATQFLKEWNHTVESEDREGLRSYLATWTDPATALQITAEVKVHEAFPAIDWVLHFKNGGTSDTPSIEDIQALDLVLQSEDPKASFLFGHNRGDVFGESSFENIDTPLEPGGAFAMAPTGGRSSNGAFPFFDARFGESTVVGAIGWSGQWELSVNREDENNVRIRAGMQKTHLVLHPGERIRSPRILLLVNTADPVTAHNRFRRLMLFHYVPQQDGRPVALPVASQCFDRYSWTVSEWATEAGQVDAVEQAARLGFDTHWFDAAWFVGGFPDGVGNWFPKPEAFPRGLRPVGDACHERGLKFVLWFEPERVVLNTRIANEHPEFVFAGEKSRLFRLDLPEARRWLTDLLSGHIEEYALDVYRNDFNIDPLRFWQSNDTPDRVGMTEIRYIEGLYEMWDELLERHPGLLIDNCASGGRRIDLELCKRSVPFWRSDTNCFPGNADWNPVHSAGISYYLPLHMACAWEPDPYQVRAAATAGLICQWPYRDEGFPSARARQLLEEAKTLQKYWYGDLYPLSTPSAAAEHWCVFQLHRPDLAEGIAAFFHRTKSPYTSIRVALKALEPEAMYAVERWSEDGHCLTEQIQGKDLRTGFEVSLLDAPSSLIVRYRKQVP